MTFINFLSTKIESVCVRDSGVKNPKKLREKVEIMCQTRFRLLQLCSTAPTMQNNELNSACHMIFNENTISHENRQMFIFSHQFHLLSIWHNWCAEQTLIISIAFYSTYYIEKCSKMWVSYDFHRKLFFHKTWHRR